VTKKLRSFNNKTRPLDFTKNQFSLGLQAEIWRLAIRFRQTENSFLGGEYQAVVQAGRVSLAKQWDSSSINR